MATLPFLITEEATRACLNDDPITRELTDDLFRRFIARADALVRQIGDMPLGVHDYSDIAWFDIYENTDDAELDTAEGQLDVIEALAEADMSFRLICLNAGLIKDGA